MDLEIYDIYIGEWLSYPQERITIGKVREMQQLESNPLACCFLIANGEKKRRTSFGIGDELSFEEMFRLPKVR